MNEKAPAPTSQAKREGNEAVEQVPQPEPGHKLDRDRSGMPQDGVLSGLVSMVAHAKATQTSDVHVEEVLTDIRDGEWRMEVEHIRSEYARARDAGRDAKAAVAELKKQLPGVLWSGRFRRRANAELLAHSGLLCADLDDVSDHHLGEALTSLTRSPHVVAIFRSPTVTGLKALFCVPASADAHLASFRAVQNHVQELTGCKIDEACKDVARLCFVSYDPQLWLRSGEAHVLEACTQTTQSHITHKGTEYPDGCGGAALAPWRLVYTIEEAVAIAQPREKHGNHRLLYKLAGALWAYEETTGTELTNPQLRDIFRQWHARATPFLKSEQGEEEYFLEWGYAVDSCGFSGIPESPNGALSCFSSTGPRSIA